MKSISIDSNSILDMSTKKPMSEIIDFSKEYVTTETDKDTVYKAGEGINISSDNTISIDQGDSAGVEPADAATAGIMKLYGETGANSDGTMTQESITDELDNKAPIDSPEFTGTPTAPTPNSSDEGSDRLATTAYILSLLKDNPGIIDEMLTAINGKLDKTTADNTYLTKTAANTYLTQTAANNTYLTQSSAESTYAKKTNETLTNTTFTGSNVFNNNRNTVVINQPINDASTPANVGLKILYSDGDGCQYAPTFIRFSPFDNSSWGSMGVFNGGGLYFHAPNVSFEMSSNSKKVSIKAPNGFYVNGTKLA